VGTPAGAAATARIGVSGGQLRSRDGRVTVDVPTGALGADTELTVQPITNTAHGGLGRAYRLGPEGQVFKQPVTLTFAYKDEEVEGSAPEALAVVFQTAERYWQLVETKRDLAAKTVSAKTNHFGMWAFATRLRLAPKSTSVGVGKSVTLTVEFCQAVEGKPDSKGTQPFYGFSCRPIKPNLGYLMKDWAVNDVPGGNDLVGKLAPSAEQAVYTAPGVRPQPATVEASAVFTFKDTTFRVHSRIRVIDVPPTLNGTYVLDYKLEAPEYVESFHIVGTFAFSHPSGGPNVYTYRAGPTDVTGKMSNYVKDHVLSLCTTTGGLIGRSTGGLALRFDPAGSFVSANLKGRFPVSCVSKTGNPPFKSNVSLDAQFGAGTGPQILVDEMRRTSGDAQVFTSEKACETLYAAASTTTRDGVPFPDSVSGHARYTCDTVGGRKTVVVSWSAGGPK
jgi:hypothetical protein